MNTRTAGLRRQYVWMWFEAIPPGSGVEMATKLLPDIFGNITPVDMYAVVVFQISTVFHSVRISFGPIHNIPHGPVAHTQSRIGPSDSIYRVIVFYNTGKKRHQMACQLQSE